MRRPRTPRTRFFRVRNINMSDPTRFAVNGRTHGPAVELLNRLFDDATRQGASDIHFEDGDFGCSIRFRNASGDLQDIQRIDRDLAQVVDEKIRAACDLSLHERHAPMDGRMFIEVDDRMVDVRVSVVPTRCGQSLVCRLLDQKNASRRLHEIEMTDAVRAAIADVIQEPEGLILLSGPTGSGKTTTLYSILNDLNEPHRKIITVEDPVEYRLENATQINVDRDQLPFARALRSILRQDPDIILVGEIRDAETAQIAVEASYTGHLVLASIHANDAAGTITRLDDLGVNKLNLALALRAIIAQRLPKRLCSACSEEKPLIAGEREWLTLTASHHLDTPFRVACGCDQCVRGVKGRVPVMEMLLGGPAMRRAIGLNNRAEIMRAARQQPQYESLAEAGLRHAVAGDIALAEVRRLTSSLEEVMPVGDGAQNVVPIAPADRSSIAVGERR